MPQERRAGVCRTRRPSRSSRTTRTAAGRRRTRGTNCIAPLPMWGRPAEQALYPRISKRLWRRGTPCSNEPNLGSPSYTPGPPPISFLGSKIANASPRKGLGGICQTRQGSTMTPNPGATGGAQTFFLVCVCMWMRVCVCVCVCMRMHLRAVHTCFAYVLCIRAMHTCYAYMYTIMRPCLLFSRNTTARCCYCRVRHSGAPAAVQCDNVAMVRQQVTPGGMGRQVPRAPRSGGRRRWDGRPRRTPIAMAERAAKPVDGPAAARQLLRRV